MALTEKYVSSLAAGGGDGSSGSPWTWAEMVTDINAGGKAGNRYNVKADGTYSRTTTVDTISGSGSSTAPVIIRGYSSAIGDGYQGRTAGAGLVTTNMPAVTYSTGRLSVTGTFIILESLNISGAPSAAVVTISADSAVKSCAIVNSSTNAAAAGMNGSAARAVVFDCDCSLTGASGGNYALQISGNSARALCNRVTGGPNIGILSGNASSVIAFNVVHSSAGLGISMNSTSGAPTILWNTVVSGTTDGIDIVTGTTVLQCMVGNMVTDNGGYGIDLNNVAVASFMAYARTRDNTSGAANLGTDWVAATSYGNVTTDTGGAATDYVDATGDDYRLIAASPATSAAQPASASIGALQRDQTGAGGASSSSYAYIG